MKTKQAVASLGKYVTRIEKISEFILNHQLAEGVMVWKSFTDIVARYRQPIILSQMKSENDGGRR